jgi:hypothetical protein
MDQLQRSISTNFDIFFLKFCWISQVTGDVLGQGQGNVHWNIACAHMNSRDKASALAAAVLAHINFLACLGAEHPQTQQVKGAIESMQ